MAEINGTAGDTTKPISVEKEVTSTSTTDDKITQLADSKTASSIKDTDEVTKVDDKTNEIKKDLDQKIETETQVKNNPTVEVEPKKDFVTEKAPETVVSNDISKSEDKGNSTKVEPEPIEESKEQIVDKTQGAATIIKDTTDNKEVVDNKETINGKNTKTKDNDAASNKSQQNAEVATSTSEDDQIYPEGVTFKSSGEKKNFNLFFNKLPEITKEADYDELFGHQLSPTGDFYDETVAKVLAFKFLKANDFLIPESESQLKNTLIWRKEFKPLSAAFLEEHKKMFNNIGYLTNNSENPENCKVITWNIYGAKSPVQVAQTKDYFIDLDEFLRWRIGLMEKSVQLLDFKDKENQFVAQVHDYKDISFLRMDASIKRSTKSTIKIFQDYYPELLSRKFFLNIPFILAWFYNYVVKNFFISKETVAKFRVLSDASTMAEQINTKKLPKAYGGELEDLVTLPQVEIQQTPYTKFLLEKLSTDNAEGFTNEVD
ncbi:Sfh5p [Ascoidea rubescens DSM 1968]|uniref:Phosphatidylinositol transfer protein SFH5 n=1 Tax=Ascoidea rubescens DSM 1968 TaxID=1344418 RepID=A0A1D2VJU9_9ASCO|nr:CRAL/TRIO domain-containing protein [Ascoidea rubescens DSM 1968]ODV61787.1 CRAL/TRIO domain-containing protein [Ascoidea rubescens DSM 1968]